MHFSSAHNLLHTQKLSGCLSFKPAAAYPVYAIIKYLWPLIKKRIFPQISNLSVIHNLLGATDEQHSTTGQYPIEIAEYSVLGLFREINQYIKIGRAHV